MRQILINDRGAFVARVPRPMVLPGCVLVRVAHSFVSVGTEVAGLRPASRSGSAEVSSGIVGAAARAQRIGAYFGAALRNPQRAVRRAAQIVGAHASRRNPWLREPPPLTPALRLGQLSFVKASAAELEVSDGGLRLRSDGSAGAYQALAGPIALPAGCVPAVELQGAVEHGEVVIGLLNAGQKEWLGSRIFAAGQFEDRLSFEPRGSKEVTLVIAASVAPAVSELRLDAVNIYFVPASFAERSEIEDQGWNVGYSAAGTVVEVGEGVTEFAPGDVVACAGAGQANHADYVCVRRNLVVRVPSGCSTRTAAATTVGAIALQGIRRAQLQLGERVAILGLGLIGQLSAQLARASGASVIGLDPNAARVQRARELGIEWGASEIEGLRRLVRDVTAGRGADKTLITAAAKSDDLINLAMEVTRAKGTVVIVGDVGLGVKRQDFYRKEIDLLMSTSYGPGRYDPEYEEEGRDYPYAYVRWTLNRNMRAFLDQAAAGRVDVERLIDRVVPVSEAPALYRALAESPDPPLAALIAYPDAEPAEDSEVRITVRGHKRAPQGPIRYALVGAGAFGTSMLVPQLARCGDRFFLRGVVSRDAVRGGNFARAQRAEVLSSSLDEVLEDEGFDLVVIATRHHEHAEQVARSLEAGKHVFVEKPLALSWDQLERVTTTVSRLGAAPLLMVGFNRRFSPAIQSLKQALGQRRSPLVIDYRLNAGYVPMDSWLHGPQGGGRNLGEACHMYDVFRFLTGSPLRSIQATAIDPGSLPYKKNDNFCATLRHEDGSLATLVYTALGPKALPKERIEVFCDGEAFLVDDYKKLTRTSDGSVLWESSEVDKGHFEELRQLGEAIAVGGPAPIPLDELIEVSMVALQVEDELRQGAASR